ncbi:MAG: 4-(cytidine 5'-diphospho)-2-C-methyl-D-erythritol kinase [Peptostreptococcaceae bacterium]|nr:4-(cytidine 5'-diphospho)-2-C-methyl-D-erythritol kinase [Peptostreptococcaceae bacterium]
MIILRGKARAKINFFLNVEGKRPDGYHDIMTVMQQINLWDDVEIDVQKGNGIIISTDLPYLPVGIANIAYKAAKALQDRCNIDRMLKIKIRKGIPVSAGLAGGSSDAAAVLRLLDSGLSLGLPEETLMEEALKIGADVPFCLMGKAALAEGVGERLTPINGLEKGFILLSKPNIAVSTAKVYKALDLKEGVASRGILGAEAVIREMAAGNLDSLSDKLYNRLEDVTLIRHPIVGDIKSKMLQYGARGALMSGSGPTVFGIFKDYKRVSKAYKNLKKTYSQTYITVAYSKEENR